MRIGSSGRGLGTVFSRCTLSQSDLKKSGSIGIRFSNGASAVTAGSSENGLGNGGWARRLRSRAGCGAALLSRGLSVVGAVLQSLGGISVAVLRPFGRIDVFPGANGFAVGGLRGDIAALSSQLSALSSQPRVLSVASEVIGSLGDGRRRSVIGGL